MPEVPKKPNPIHRMSGALAPAPTMAPRITMKTAEQPITMTIGGTPRRARRSDAAPSSKKPAIMAPAMASR